MIKPGELTLTQVVSPGALLPPNNNAIYDEKWRLHADLPWQCSVDMLFFKAYKWKFFSIQVVSACCDAKYENQCCNDKVEHTLASTRLCVGIPFLHNIVHHMKFCHVKGLVNVLWNGFNLCSQFTFNLVQRKPIKERVIDFQPT